MDTENVCGGLDGNAAGSSNSNAEQANTEDACASGSAASSATDSGKSNAPTCIIVLGMAGSGKTTFVQRLVSELHAKNQPPYVVNLDPACANLPYPCNIDIRDTVKYSEVMRTYQLGPNGAIMTSLNLFATRFGSVVSAIEKRGRARYCVIDTPGQIEVFSWSASGTIIAESLAAGFPTVIAYVVDSVRCASPHTFVSNMLYACSTFFKFRLPLVVVFNKCDVRPSEQLSQWLTDWESLDAAVAHESAYVSNLTRSLSLVLDDFYSDLRHVGVSALTGLGVDEFLAKVTDAEKEYAEEVLPELEARRKRAAEKRAKRSGDDAATEADVSWCWWRSHVGSDDNNDKDDEDEDEGEDDVEHEFAVARARGDDDEELADIPIRQVGSGNMELDQVPSTRPKAKAASNTQKKVTFAD